MNTIHAYLKQLELSEIEAKLYLSLLQTGPISVRDIAIATEIKRTTAYLYIDQLVEKGLIIKLVKGAKKLIAANPPESLASLVGQKMASAEKAEKQYSEVISLLKAKLPEEKGVENAEIRYYNGKTGVKKIYEEALKGSEFRLYAHMSELGNLLFPNDIRLDFDLFEKALKENPKLKIYEIISDDPESVRNYKLDATVETDRYKYKFMPSKVGLTAPGILLYDNNVAIITAGEKLNTIVLHNQEYYINSAKLFDFIWNVLPNPKK